MHQHLLALDVGAVLCSAAVAAPSASDRAALNHVKRAVKQLGLSGADVREAAISSSVVTAHNATDNRVTARGVGTCLTFEQPAGLGIRPTQYTTDMSINPSTYASVADTVNISQPHGIGCVCNSMLWQMYWNLVDRYGYNPNLYQGRQTGGGNLAFQLVMNGMKMHRPAGRLHLAGVHRRGAGAGRQAGERRRDAAGRPGARQLADRLRLGRHLPACHGAPAGGQQRGGVVQLLPTSPSPRAFGP